MYKIKEKTEFEGLPKSMEMAANRVVVIDEKSIKFQWNGFGSPIRMEIPYFLFYSEDIAISETQTMANVEKLKDDLTKEDEKVENARLKGRDKHNEAKIKRDQAFLSYQEEVSKIDKGAARTYVVGFEFDVFDDFAYAMLNPYDILFTAEEFKGKTLTKI